MRAEMYSDDPVRNRIVQVLFTSPGEWVNLPEFGCGLLGSVFTPADGERLAVLEYTVHEALERRLSDVIDVVNVRAEVLEHSLNIVIEYVRVGTAERKRETISLGEERMDAGKTERGRDGQCPPPE